MVLAPMPADEAKRIESLRALKILDTPHEERFDRITRLATEIFDVPIAYVSLVDTDRQWLKSARGMNVCQTNRDVSFCGHAIMRDEPLVVSDTLNDPRFQDNPMVRGEPRIRFYAGHPVSGPGGYKVGTLCIADRRPRELSDREVNALRDLARVVERELSLSDVILLQEDLIEAQERVAGAEKSRAESLERLVESQNRLSTELAEAARYVRSMLPDPLHGTVSTHWCFSPCSQLGGDAFGYHWLDDDHLAVYLLDVCGHGVGSALMSVSAINDLRAGTLPKTNFHDPSQVLTALNRAYQMDRHDNRFFTIWYGVINPRKRKIRFASGGHPPAILLTGESPDKVRAVRLATENPFIGLCAESSFVGSEVSVEPFATLFVFSDGAYEIQKGNDGMMQIPELEGELLRRTKAGTDPLSDILSFLHDAAGKELLDDDVSIVQVTF
ncbi:MAG TPA: SpoIIE family protein phosphatase [Phycisphaerae bacterium]|nr:SpoIIE family protein phosphatase [Phycisphaerae bacterium]